MTPDPEIASLARTDGRYSPEAFALVLEALEQTVEFVKQGRIPSLAPYANERSPKGQKNQFHVSGRELIEGFRIHLCETYGRMAPLLLHRTGLRRTEDIGEIVFLLVEAGRLSKRPHDSRVDFAHGYDFTEAFAPPPEAE
ncbi:MAG: Minf_1886 family protein [Planctomycetota bacterium]